MALVSYSQTYTWRRAYFPFNDHDSWTSIAFNPLSHGRVIFVGPDFPGAIFRSDDGGHTWVGHDSLIDPNGVPISFIQQIFVLPSDTNIVLAIGTNNFYRSTDGGLTWNDLYNDDTLGGSTPNGFGGIGAECLDYNAQEDALYYGADNFNQHGTWNEILAGVWRSTDHGADWTLIAPDTINDSTINDSTQQYSFAASQDSPPDFIQSSTVVGSLLAYSSDIGAHWNFTFFGTGVEETPKIVFSWNEVSPLTGKHDVAIVQRWPTIDSSLVATSDGGKSWEILKTPARLWGLDIDQRVSMVSKPGDPAYPLPLHYFTGFFNVRSDTVPNGMIQETMDGGISWHSTNFPVGVAGDTANPLVRGIWVIKYDTTTGRLAVATDSGVYIGDFESGVSTSPAPQAGIELYQNASSLSLTSQTPINSVRLFDVTGREVFEAEPENTSFQLNPESYPRGVYAIEAFAEGQLVFRKLIQF